MPERAPPSILNDVSLGWHPFLIDDELFSVSKTLRVIQHRNVFASGVHEGGVAGIWDIETGEVGVAHHKQAPGIVAFALPSNFLRMRPRVDCGELT